MMSREEFNGHLVAIASGNWESVTRLNHYFEVDSRLFQTPSPQKIEQIRQCYSYMLAAEQHNNAFAIAYLGYLIEYGYGVEKNHKLAVEKYRISAEKYNNPWGQYYLGYHHLNLSEKSYFDSSKKAENAKAQELFLKAANQGHGQSAYYYAQYLDSGSEKDRWNRIARQNGSIYALYDTICPKSWGNPLRLYMPNNKGIVCQWEKQKEVSSVSTYSGKVNYHVTNYIVTISYENEIVLRENLENTYPQSYAKTLKLAKFDMGKVIPMGIIAFLTCPITVPYLCCVNCRETPCTCNWLRETYKDEKDRNRIASSIDTVSWEERLSQLIRKADGLVSQKLSIKQHITDMRNYVLNAPSQIPMQQPPIQQSVASQEIKLSDEQFKIWMAAQGLQHPSANVVPMQQIQTQVPMQYAPVPQSMEGQPLIRHSSSIPNPNVSPIYVVPSSSPNPHQFFTLSSSPSAPMVHAMEMAVSHPNQSVRLPSGANLTFK